jgi:hypothetical protein
LPWSQLTTISVVACDTADVAHILRHAVSVVELRGTLWGDNEGSEQVPPLMHLKTLTLDDESNNHKGTLMLLLDALTVPALEHLTISELGSAAKFLVPRLIPRRRSLLLHYLEKVE